MKTKDRMCGECGNTTKHIISGDTDYCTVCGVTDTSELLGNCEIAYCTDAATHLVVLDSGRSDHRSERYCESHVALAADDVRADPARDLVYGPVGLE